MNEIIREVFKEDFDRAEETGKEIGKEDTAVKMLQDNISASQISKWTGLTIEKIKLIAKKAGVATITL